MYDVEKTRCTKHTKKDISRQELRHFKTQGDLAGLTGGRMNTWAISAASQARQSWDERLMDVVHETL